MVDQAIESRIHIHIEFPQLPASARTIVWRNFLARLPEDSKKLTDQDLEKLGCWNLNGRQIKNALFMTLSWCRQKGKPVTFEGIENIIEMTCLRASKSNGKGQDTANSDLLTL